MIRKRAGTAANFTVMSLLSLTFVFPLIYMLVNSLKTMQDYNTNPFNLPPSGRWMFSNYTVIFSQFQMLTLFKTTAIIDVSSCALVIVLAIFCSYAIAKMRFKFLNVCHIFIIATIFIPSQVTMIPMYVMFAKINLLNNYWAVILSYLAGSLPSNILLMVSFFRGIPDEIMEAARIDGCGFFSTIRNVIVPMGLPAIVINIIFNIIFVWNDLFIPMILLPKYEMRTVMVALAQLISKDQSDPTFQLTGLFISTIPALAVYFAMQRYIIKGITIGAIK